MTALNLAFLKAHNGSRNLNECAMKCDLVSSGLKSDSAEASSIVIVKLNRSPSKPQVHAVLIFIYLLYNLCTYALSFRHIMQAKTRGKRQLAACLTPIKRLFTCQVTTSEFGRRFVVQTARGLMCGTSGGVAHAAVVGWLASLTPAEF